MICLRPPLAVKEPELSIVSSNRFHCEESAKKLSVNKKSIKETEISIVSWKRFFGTERGKNNFESHSLRRRFMMIEPTGKMTDASTSLLLTSGSSGRVNARLSLRVLRSLVMLINAFVMFMLLPFRGRRRCVTVSADKAPKDEKQEISSVRKTTVVRVPTAMVTRRSNLVATAEQEVVVRRALAIRRATQDDDRSIVREVFLFVTARGETLFTQTWTPVSINIKYEFVPASTVVMFCLRSKDPLDAPQLEALPALSDYLLHGRVYWCPNCMDIFSASSSFQSNPHWYMGVAIIVHGLNEHSGRYSDFAKQLNANGFKVYGMDWIGHGGSDGLHGYVHSLGYAVSDMKEFVEKVTAENPGRPCFCFGHSTGAAIILKALLDPKIEAVIEGVVLTSPALRVQPSHPIVGMLAPIFSFLLPKYQFGGANKKGMPVSRDPEALVVKYSDPLVYTGSIRVRTGTEILQLTTYLQQHLRRLSVPFLVLHGTADTLTDPEASQKLYEEASSADKSIKLYEGFLHDLLFEPERDDIANHIIYWLNSRVKV